MDKLILNLYEQIQVENIRNRIDSKFWIYHTENFFFKKGKETKRYLKVLFFNRRLDQERHLLRLTFQFSEDILNQEEFSVVSQYQNMAVLGFVREIDFDCECNQIDILSYICEDGIQKPHGEYVDMFLIHFNIEKLDAIRKYSTTKLRNMLLLPFFSEKFWLCSCGYINAGIDDVCACCGKTAQMNQELLALDPDKLVLEHLQETIKISSDETIEDTIQRYCHAVHDKYHIRTDTILSYIDKEALISNQMEMIRMQIQKYVEEHHIVFDTKLTFDENLNQYCKPICGKVIKKRMLFEYLDIGELKKSYKQEMKRKKLKFIRNIMILLLIFVIAVALILFTLNQQKDHPLSNDKEVTKKENVTDKKDNVAETKKHVMDLLKKNMELTSLRCHKNIDGVKVEYWENNFFEDEVHDRYQYAVKQTDAFQYTSKVINETKWLYKKNGNLDMQLRLYKNGVKEYTTYLSEQEESSYWYEHKMLGFVYLFNIVFSEDSRQYTFTETKEGDKTIINIAMQEDEKLEDMVKQQFRDAGADDEIKNIHVKNYDVSMIVNDKDEIESITYHEVYDFPNGLGWNLQTTYEYHEQNQVDDSVFEEFYEVWE